MPDWRPLVTDPDRRAQVRRVIREIVEAVPVPADDEMSLHLDLAVTRAYLAQDDTVPDPDEVTGHALARSVTAFASAVVQPSLFGGAAQLGWTLEHLAGGEDAATVCTAIDRALLQRLAAWDEDYDLIVGLVGFGVYALERGEAGSPVAMRVLELLEQTARPRDGGVAWFTPPALLPEWQREVAPEGYWNYGLAHGLPGVVGLLARFVKFEIGAARARVLLEGAMTALLAVTTDHCPQWLPPAQGTTERRAAWCYGDLGASFGMLAAAQVSGRDDWRERALGLARGCAGYDDPTIRDGGLCHGTSGAMHLFDRLASSTGEPVFAGAALRWLDRTLAIRNDSPVAGYPIIAGDQHVPSASVLTGAPGVALALHAMVSEVEPSWDRVLLVDV